MSESGLAEPFASEGKSSACRKRNSLIYAGWTGPTLAASNGASETCLSSTSRKSPGLSTFHSRNFFAEFDDNADCRGAKFRRKTEALYKNGPCTSAFWTTPFSFFDDVRERFLPSGRQDQASAESVPTARLALFPETRPTSLVKLPTMLRRSECRSSID